MTTFYICRHGESQNNKKHLLQGWLDSPLTELGIQNAVSSAKKLENIQIDKIISSDLGRALQTAYIISRKIGYLDEIEFNRELREVNYGQIAGLPYSQYPDITADENTNYTPPGGESLAQMHKRVLQCVDKINQENPDKAILLVAHDGTINAIRASLEGESAGEADTVHNPHDLVVKFTFQNGKTTSFEELAP